MREGDLWCMDLIEECIKMSRIKNALILRVSKS